MFQQLITLKLSNPTYFSNKIDIKIRLVNPVIPITKIRRSYFWILLNIRLNA